MASFRKMTIYAEGGASGDEASSAGSVRSSRPTLRWWHSLKGLCKRAPSAHVVGDDITVAVRDSSHRAVIVQLSHRALLTSSSRRRVQAERLGIVCTVCPTELKIIGADSSQSESEDDFSMMTRFKMFICSNGWNEHHRHYVVNVKCCAASCVLQSQEALVVRPADSLCQAEMGALIHPPSQLIFAWLVNERPALDNLELSVLHFLINDLQTSRLSRSPALMATLVASCLGAIACSGFRLIGTSIASSSARAAYCSFFALSLIVSWILRYQAKPLIEKIPCARSHGWLLADRFTSVAYTNGLTKIFLQRWGLQGQGRSFSPLKSADEISLVPHQGSSATRRRPYQRRGTATRRCTASL